MPIYEYECGECGSYMEALQKMSDDPLKQCPKCGKDALKKLISAAGFRLKGGGWYETDFKSGGKRNLHQDTAKSDSGNSGSAKAAEPAKKSGGDGGASKKDT